MRRVKEFFVLFAISITLFFLSSNFGITGGIIGVKQFNFSFVQILSLIFFMGFLLVFSSKKTLDVLIVPTGDGIQNPKRAKKAIEEWDKDEIGKIMISGRVDKNSENKIKNLRNSERYSIYKTLREGKIKPYEISISGGKDSVENILYSFDKIKNVKSVGIISYPEHLKRFEYIFKKAKKEGIISKDTELMEIPTEQSLKEYFYGKVANLREYWVLRNGIKNRSKKENILFKYVKKFFGG